MHERVVNRRSGRPYDIYIGRPPAARDTGQHFGNPFSDKPDSRAAVILPTREEAVAAFRDWLLGHAWQDVEPDRRRWILDHLHELKGKRLGCWCAPLLCHGEVLLELAEKER